MNRPTQLIVFSDLDGTLLDHDTYEHDAARPAIEALRRAAIPLVLVTSKTAAEVAVLRAALDNTHPFIVENGAATFIPAGYFDDSPSEAATDHDFEIESSGPRRAVLLAELGRLRAEFDFRFTGFSEMGAGGIAEATGLTPAAAARANDRTASEPVLWRDSGERLQQFESLLDTAGLRCVRGGRFVQVGGQFDKGAAVAALLHRYRRQYPDHDVISVALGDGPNDLSMLARADTAVVVRGKHDHDMPLPTGTRVLRTRLAGPAGWNEAVLSMLGDTRPERLI